MYTAGQSVHSVHTSHTYSFSIVYETMVFPCHRYAIHNTHIGFAYNKRPNHITYILLFANVFPNFDREGNKHEEENRESSGKDDKEGSKGG